MNMLGAVSTQNHATAVPQPRLVQAAHEFEAQLMKELLKPMTNSTSIDGDDADPGSGGALADFGTEALGLALSKRGGLGIATDILRSLSRNDKESEPSSNLGTEMHVSSKAGDSWLK